MARYYYDKHQIKTRFVEGVWTDKTSSVERINELRMVYQSYTMSPDHGFYLDFPVAKMQEEYAGYYVGTQVYVTYFKSIQSITETHVIYNAKQCLRVAQDVKGDLIETVTAEDGTYPENGIQNGFWYVKKERAFPDFKMKIDSELKSSDNGWVKIDGQLKEIDKIWIKADGTLKEV